jgi:hypothetical protein
MVSVKYHCYGRGPNISHPRPLRAYMKIAVASQAAVDALDRALQQTFEDVLKQSKVTKQKKAKMQPAFNRVRRVDRGSCRDGCAGPTHRLQARQGKCVNQRPGLE